MQVVYENWKDKAKEHTYQSLVSLYLAEQSACGVKKGSIQTKRYRLLKLSGYLFRHGSDYRSFGPAGARNWRRELLSSGELSLSHTAHLESQARVFFRWMEQRGDVLANPFETLDPVRLPKTLPKNVLKEEEAGRLLDTLRVRFERMSERFPSFLTHLSCEILYGTGMRINELAMLKVDDIDLYQRELIVREGKGGFSRICYLPEYVSILLAKYLSVVRPRIPGRPGYLIPVSVNRLDKIIRMELEMASKEAKVTRPTSHGFRHAFATHLLKSGCPVRYIQVFLGHKSLDRTEVYTRLGKDDLKKTLDDCHPRGMAGHPRSGLLKP